MNWISFHLFFTSSINIFLKNCISPLITELIDTKKISSYFFILYNENGSHIRLRLMPIATDSLVINIVHDCVLQHFINFPSPVDLNRDKSFFPNDSIQIIPYEPEIDRYGGIFGINIAEEQFRNSTDIVFRFIKTNKSEAYNSLLNVAFKLHLTTAYVYTKGDLEESILFFNYLFSASYLYKDNNFVKRHDEYKLTYHGLYLKQKIGFIPFVASIWQALKMDEIPDELIQTWIKKEDNIRDKIQLLLNENKLDFTTTNIFENHPHWMILHSYMHMTNNRLGILPIDEVLIYYYIMKCLQEMKL